MELSKNTTIDYKVLVRTFVIAIIIYFVYTMSNNSSTSIITLPMATQDSPYRTPEGWPLPYPYVAPPSN